MERSTKSTSIAKWARYGHWLSLLGGLVVVVFVAQVAFDQDALQRFFAGEVVEPFRPPNRETLFGAMLVAAIPNCLLLYGLWTSSRFFGLVQAGHLLDAKCQGALTRLARISFAWAVTNAFSRSLLTFILTSSNPPGQRILTIGLSFADFISLIIAILFLMFSHLQKQMVEFSEDSENII
jgi:hypothetical protein